MMKTAYDLNLFHTAKSTLTMNCPRYKIDVTIFSHLYILAKFLKEAHTGTVTKTEILMKPPLDSTIIICIIKYSDIKSICDNFKKLL